MLVGMPVIVFYDARPLRPLTIYAGSVERVTPKFFRVKLPTGQYSDVLFEKRHGIARGWNTLMADREYPGWATMPYAYDDEFGSVYIRDQDGRIVVRVVLTPGWRDRIDQEIEFAKTNYDTGLPEGFTVEYLDTAEVPLPVLPAGVHERSHGAPRAPLLEQP